LQLRLGLRSRLAAFAAAVILMFISTGTRADDTITDPRGYCDRVVELAANGDVNALTSDLVAHSNGALSEVEFRAALAGFEAVSIKVGPLKSHEHVSEWKAGDAFVRHWYILIYERGPLFIRCTMYRPGRHWLVFDFLGNSDPEKVGTGR
jgi:hypothetical protein